MESFKYYLNNFPFSIFYFQFVCEGENFGYSGQSYKSFNVISLYT